MDSRLGRELDIINEVAPVSSESPDVYRHLADLREGLLAWRVFVLASKV